MTFMVKESWNTHTYTCMYMYICIHVYVCVFSIHYAYINIYLWENHVKFNSEKFWSNC